MSKIGDSIKKTWKNEFVQGFLILFSGSTIAQAIPLLATIILARLFVNDVFGLFFLYSTTVTILSIIATLKYELAIVLPKNTSDSINLLVLSILVCILISTILLIFIIIFNKRIALLLGNDDIQPWLYFIPASVFFTGLFQSTNNWFLRQKKYKKISIARITKASTAAVGQTATGITKFNFFGLVPGLLAGQFISAFANVYICYKQIKPELKNISYSRIKKLANEHKNLPLFSTLISFSNSLSNQLPIILLTRYYGLTSTSYYGMAHRLVGTPMGLVGQSVSQMFFKKASDIYNSRSDLTTFLKKTYLNLFKVGIIPFSVLFIGAPVIIRIVLGNDWVEVSLYIRILIPWLFIGFLNSPVTHIITVLRKQQQMLVYEIALLTARFIALFSGYYFYNNVIFSVVLFSSVGVVFNLIMVFVLIRFSKQHN